MSYHGLSMWNGSSKIHYFIDIWNSFCWRPWRPWMLLSTKFKGHKSNFRISGMYRFCFYDLKVHFWWPNKSSKHQVLSVNTLYSVPDEWATTKCYIVHFCNKNHWKLINIFQLQYFFSDVDGTQKIRLKPTKATLPLRTAKIYRTKRPTE